MLEKTPKKHQNSHDLLADSTKNNLYFKLILQLNKDFKLANFDCEIPVESTPSDLKEILYHAIKNVIIDDFSTYKNILYIADISEEMIRKIDNSNMDIYVENVVFLLLKRVWKKVWFSANYTNL
ncbi:hypothetical protein [Tenacibaculum piscium]|uniref:Uncharacterized protein n=1 Tax=Tenacibaculum piscium TaxID=1458515 RepID=A0A2H1YJ33_9FLAO|nr:hypothetical protein [Tenacibaculum piscium]MBE7628716.1 hypothetical protein [Tenacibaculum piscium]MBE7669857.1 hypothetical protein [Tenacibaculum piscium]MBE7684548.1 hypothetical protein [Tenacibaculum piscium]MBE7689168.1 hypothetical protein [Tenacibaculum piscium]SOS75505.1 conserved hypothetical protein [Tenacibaculum piscium]